MRNDPSLKEETNPGYPNIGPVENKDEYKPNKSPKLTTYTALNLPVHDQLPDIGTLENTKSSCLACETEPCICVLNNQNLNLDLEPAIIESKNVKFALFQKLPPTRLTDLLSSNTEPSCH